MYQAPKSNERGAQSPDYHLSVNLVPDFVRLLDIAMVVISSVVTYSFLVEFNPKTLDFYIFAVVFISICSFFLFSRAELYSIQSIMRPVGVSDYVIIGIATSFLFFLTICFSLKTTEIYSRMWLTSFGITSVVAVLFARVIVYHILSQLSDRQLLGRSMVVLGIGSQSERFLERYKTVAPHFVNVMGVFGVEKANLPSSFHGYNILGDVKDLVELARRGKVEDVVIALPWNDDEAVKGAINTLNELPVNVYISTDLVGYQLSFKPAMGAFNTLPLFEVSQRPISGWSILVKAAEDRILGLLFLILLLPVFAVTALAIRLDSKGPILFKQERFGFNNERFSIYKFRSMYHNEVPEKHVKQASRGDPRVTRVGRFIRRTSIDELPQLLNVLNGTMSIVGPRPHAISHNEEYSHEIRGYYARHKVKPGITGWAQVNGLRGETEDIALMEDRVRHDVFYAENWSLLFDIRIIIMTAIVLFFQKSAY